ncbi:MAG: hypothetical protein ACYS0K_17785 [Planctomycetota bacterium]
MIVNGLSVIAAFAAALRVAVGLLLATIGARAVWRRHRSDRSASDARFYLLVTLAVTLLGLSVASWPLFYLVLQSYVPEWPGVMCIQGVTRIGSASVGAAALLPGLIDLLEVTKPALVFCAGVWLVLHLANRASRTGVLTGRVLAALAVFGLLATIDGAAESAYLFIPKKENILATGCCTTGPVEGASGLADPLALAGPAGGRDGLTLSFFAVGAALVVALAVCLRRLRRGSGPGPWLAFSTAAALASLPLGFAFVGTVAAPTFLRLPYHYCGYCLVASAPESLVGITLFLAGAFAVGWASAARWLGATREGATGSTFCLPLVRLALFSCLGAHLMMATRLVFP